MNKPDYEGFALALCRMAFDGCDASGGEIQDIGVKYGVLVTEIFDPEAHKNVANIEYIERGDVIYCFVPTARTALQEKGERG